MPFSISDFRSQGLSGGGARPNLFEVQITKVGQGALTADLQGKNFTFLCKGAAIPAQTIGTIDVAYFGRTIKVPGNKVFDNWTVTVTNDEDFSLRNAIENWMATMNSHQGNLSVVAPNDLLGEAVVRQFSRAGATIGTWEFKIIFPVNVSEIALDWATNDTIEEFTIEWAYDYWLHSPAAVA